MGPAPAAAPNIRERPDVQTPRQDRSRPRRDRSSHRGDRRPARRVRRHPPPGRRPARPAGLRRRAAPVGPGLVHRRAPEVRAGPTGRRRRGVHPRPHHHAVRLLPRHGRPGDRRQPRHHGRLLRRHLQRRAPPGGNHQLQGRQARGRGGPHRGPGQEPGIHRCRPGPRGPAGQHPVDDRPPAEPDQRVEAARRPEDLQAGLPALLPQGEHDLRGGPPGRSAHRVVGQARRLRDPQRPLRHRRSGPVHPGDQQRRPRLRRRQRLDHGQQGHRAVRRLQGEGRPQRDRRLRPQRHPQGRHPGDLRPQLPVGLHRAEAARLGRPHRRLHRQERPGPAAGEEPGLRQHGDRRPDRRDRQATPLRQHHRHPLRQARPVAHRPRRAHPRRRRPAP